MMGPESMGKRTSKEKWERNVNKHKLIQDTASYGVDAKTIHKARRENIETSLDNDDDLAPYMNQSKKIYNSEL